MSNTFHVHNNNLQDIAWVWACSTRRDWLYSCIFTFGNCCSV